MKFSETGIAHECVLGKRIEITELIGRDVVIEKVIISNSKYSGKNKSGLRMQMQVGLTDSKDPFSCFTGSDVLINQMQKAIDAYKEKLFPLETRIEKCGKCLIFK